VQLAVGLKGRKCWAFGVGNFVRIEIRWAQREGIWNQSRLDATHRSLHDLRSHWRKFVQWPVAMDAFAEINLRNGCGAKPIHDVDKHRDVDPVSLDEGQLLKHCAATTVFARKWLHDFAKFRKAHGEKWAGNKFGDSSAAANVAIDWSFVEALHKSD
jgi:hypothetical protein